MELFYREDHLSRLLAYRHIKILNHRLIHRPDPQSVDTQSNKADDERDDARAVWIVVGSRAMLEGAAGEFVWVDQDRQQGERAECADGHGQFAGH